MANFIFSFFTFSSEHVITFKYKKINVINFYISLLIFIALFLKQNKTKIRLRRLESMGLNARTNNEGALAVAIAQGMNWVSSQKHRVLTVFIRPISPSFMGLGQMPTIS